MSTTPHEFPAIPPEVANFQPADDLLLILLDQKLDPSNIRPKAEYLPSGRVLAVGPGAVNANGVRVPINFQAGQHVAFMSQAIGNLPLWPRVKQPEDRREVPLPQPEIALVQEKHILGSWRDGRPANDSPWFMHEPAREEAPSRLSGRR